MNTVWLVVIGLAWPAAATATKAACFTYDRSPGCEITRLDYGDGTVGPWWKCCEQDRQPSGAMQCRPAFEMYRETRHCAVPCSATKQQLNESARCYDKYMDGIFGAVKKTGVAR